MSAYHGGESLTRDGVTLLISTGQSAGLSLSHRRFLYLESDAEADAVISVLTEYRSAEHAEEIAALRAEVESWREHVAELAAENDRLDAELEALRDDLARRVAIAVLERLRTENAA
ncbi:hypothetical protein [Microbacterium dextranolyticum]|uniref:Uncharacterized protein n=1 Tax=Microbacterium dextranolyticum TaxID=36806 RepID=A0A9W6M6T9_9MICO|nr:hypothetical protein [Microbacterium dextranolyticum]MBM7462925.1 putative RNase H-like nuclease (RuvC/YqgF family) [Microbacterium dextranolyticum]GLJ95970.1 hypothetical protein GCM10017591_20330 [Microbacterium dextranolyticum]